MGGEALGAVEKALMQGKGEYLRRAYWLLSRLRERNSRGFQPDIPANHAQTNGPDFWTVLETLQDRPLDRMRGI
ncbi:MAG TPA: hypothetical protein VNK04_00180 [Gemmataceae bacterium]|nr:hypothetical protein [Gemmataceae bacterium]